MQRSRAVAGGLFAGYLAAWCLLGLSSPHALRAQEKKNLRPVLVSLSWGQRASVPGGHGQRLFSPAGAHDRAALYSWRASRHGRSCFRRCRFGAPGLASDLSPAVDGIQAVLEEDIQAGLVDKKMTVDRVINDGVLKLAQQESRKEGRLTP